LFVEYRHRVHESAQTDRDAAFVCVTLKIQETTMIAMKSTEVEEIQVGSAPYRGELSEVKGVSVRWLTKVGLDAEGSPAYGLRLFNVEPGGEIPVHNHSYMQTMYILSGQFECWEFDPETDEIIDKQICGPGDMIYVPSMEPHGMRNVSETQPGQFLCCICTLDSAEACPG
jgi:quercetin dioxygenase-like cupin family protein